MSRFLSNHIIYLAFYCIFFGLRHNQISCICASFEKLILGAAIEEGSLKPGDRLLEVNDQCVDGMLQADVVTLLRNVPLESTVNLMVSRHAVVYDSASTDPSAAAASLPVDLDNKIPTKDAKKLQFQLENNNDKTDEEVIMCEEEK